MQPLWWAGLQAPECRISSAAAAVFIVLTGTLTAPIRNHPAMEHRHCHTTRHGASAGLLLALVLQAAPAATGSLPPLQNLHDQPATAAVPSADGP